MNDDLRRRLHSQMIRLHERALELSLPGKDSDMALALGSIALLIEAQLQPGSESKQAWPPGQHFGPRVEDAYR